MYPVVGVWLPCRGSL